MNKDVIIAGAAGLAKEVNDILITQGWNPLGWVCNDIPTNTVIDDLPVLGPDTYLINYPKEVNVVIAVGKGQLRKKIFNLYKMNKNLRFPTIISKNAILSNRFQIGQGCIVSHSAIITTDVKIGDFCLINFGASVAHDCVISDFVSINPGVKVSGHVTIGEETMIGTGSAIHEWTKIGCNSIVGLCSSVVKDVPDNVTVYGVPARKISWKN